MHRTTSSTSPILLIVALAAIVSAGALICRPVSPQTNDATATQQNHGEAQAIGPINYDSFFDPPPQRAFPDQDQWPRGGRMKSLEEVGSDQSTNSTQLETRWQTYFASGMTFVRIVLQGPSPTKPLKFLWYHSRWISVIPVFSKSNDFRARDLIFDSENLKDVPEIWEKSWKMKLPDVAKPYRTHDGVI